MIKLAYKDEEKKKVIYNNKGITLIALIVTIVLLIILAGVTINAAVGRNSSWLGNTKELKNTQKSIEDLESDQRASIVESLELEETGITTGDYDFRIQDIRDVVFDEDIVIRDKTFNNIRIPGGFRLAADSGEKASDGIVIQDNKTGSQFVWIPTGRIYTNNSEGRLVESDLSSLFGRYSNNILIQRAADYDSSIAIDPDGNGYNSYVEAPEDENLKKFIDSVNENQGFFIGRYFAREDSENNLQPYRENYDVFNSINENEIYSMNLSQLTSALLSALDRNNYTSESNSKITLKYNKPYYNFFTLDDAKKLCDEMYENNAYVNSSLTNSYAYDTAMVIAQYFPKIQEKISDAGRYEITTETDTIHNKPALRELDNRSIEEHDFDYYADKKVMIEEIDGEISKANNVRVFNNVTSENINDVLDDIFTYNKDAAVWGRTLHQIAETPMDMAVGYKETMTYKGIETLPDSDIPAGLFNPRNYIGNSELGDFLHIENITDENGTDKTVVVIRIEDLGLDLQYDSFIIKNGENSVDLIDVLANNTYQEEYSDYEVYYATGVLLMSEYDDNNPSILVKRNEAKILFDGEKNEFSLNVKGFVADNEGNLIQIRTQFIGMTNDTYTLVFSEDGGMSGFTINIDDYNYAVSWNNNYESENSNGDQPIENFINSENINKVCEVIRNFFYINYNAGYMEGSSIYDMYNDITVEQWTDMIVDGFIQDLVNKNLPLSETASELTDFLDYDDFNEIFNVTNKYNGANINVLNEFCEKKDMLLSNIIYDVGSVYNPRNNLSDYNSEQTVIDTITKTSTPDGNTSYTGKRQVDNTSYIFNKYIYDEKRCDVNEMEVIYDVGDTEHITINLYKVDDIRKMDITYDIDGFEGSVNYTAIEEKTFPSYVYNKR